LNNFDPGQRAELGRGAIQRGENRDPKSSGAIADKEGRRETKKDKRIVSPFPVELLQERKKLKEKTGTNVRPFTALKDFRGGSKQ